MSRIVLVNQSSTPDDAGSGNAQLFIEGNELYQQVGTGDKTKVANETTSTFTSPLSVPSISAVNTCKAWVNFRGSSTVVIRDSFNVSSITDNATGNYTITFSTAMDNDDYCSVITSGDKGSTWGIPLFDDLSNYSTTSCNIWTQAPTDAGYDNVIVCAVFFGS